MRGMRASAPTRNLGELLAGAMPAVLGLWVIIAVPVLGGSARRRGKAQVGEGELVLVGTGGSHRDLDAANADPH